jgi:hypothetical protein
VFSQSVTELVKEVSEFTGCRLTRKGGKSGWLGWICQSAERANGRNDRCYRNRHAARSWQYRFHSHHCIRFNVSGTRDTCSAAARAEAPYSIRNRSVFGELKSGASWSRVGLTPIEMWLDVDAVIGG